MCGLFAGVGKLNSNRMVVLGSMNEERGTDSVGIAYMSGPDIRLAKIADRPLIALNLALRKELTEAAVSGMFIGHTRQATKGAVTSENAHPFLMDGIAFAHNGIIFNDKDFGEYAVDSQSLIHGIKARDFSRYEGPIALLWIENGELHAYRSGNPLYRGRFGTTTYLSSEEEHLEAIGCTKIKALKEAMVYTFKDGVQMETVRVPKNKSYTATVYNSNTKAKWDYGNTEKDWRAWEKEEEERENRYLLSLGKSEKKEEDFSTWKDTILPRKSCYMCANQVMTGEDYCMSCGAWVEEELGKDSPIEVKVWES